MKEIVKNAMLKIKAIVPNANLRPIWTFYLENVFNIINVQMGLSLIIQLVNVYNATLQDANNVKPKLLVLFVIKVYNSTKKDIMFRIFR